MWLHQILAVATLASMADAQCVTVSSNPGKQDYKQQTMLCVKLTEDVTEIGEQAFEQANFLYIEMPSTVTKIGKQAFKQLNQQSLCGPPFAAPSAKPLEARFDPSTRTAKLWHMLRCGNAAPCSQQLARQV